MFDWANDVDEVIDIHDAIAFARSIRADGGRLERVEKGRWIVYFDDILPGLADDVGAIVVLIGHDYPMSSHISAEGDCE